LFFWRYCDAVWKSGGLLGDDCELWKNEVAWRRSDDRKERGGRREERREERGEEGGTATNP
jgi:hypothetical protein